MNTLLLKYALEVEKSGSITQAAKRLYMNQPHLSKAIRELETTFNISIFRRTAKGMIPTKEGEKFLSYAREVLATLAKMNTIEQEKGKNNMSSFSLCSTNETHIVYALSKWASSDLNFSWNCAFHAESPLEVIDAVSEGAYNWGILCYPISQQSFLESAFIQNDITLKPLCKFQNRIITSEKVENLDNSFLSNASCVHWNKSESFESITEINLPNLFSAFLLIQNNPCLYTVSSPLPDELLSLFKLKQHQGDEPWCQEVLVYKKDYAFTKEEERFLSILSKVEKELF